MSGASSRRCGMDAGSARVSPGGGDRCAAPLPIARPRLVSPPLPPWPLAPQEPWETVPGVDPEPPWLSRVLVARDASAALWEVNSSSRCHAQVLQAAQAARL